mmetsp:Transcript_9504/g.15551  ORF Transcript_9504/g.15551 Transcript_9504/m.15551 type:complete len:130 (+) Transcript_9504:143-532(+)|eukprot:CAMPEP_0184660386 /NCGR_PEP_ID=MMETSP0308-20130426/33691_1 /TAXON_ID=38269 /ORGANISM="Gloeochaete witrockiana, Strain SAG 46.84" /LENGTH=129 /DNA_ID=CAMNT_0027100921 /DNA_START=32 /DNA_END=421 /DNA_ORIENTATION=+
MAEASKREFAVDNGWEVIGGEREINRREEIGDVAAEKPHSAFPKQSREVYAAGVLEKYADAQSNDENGPSETGEENEIDPKFRQDFSDACSYAGRALADLICDFVDKFFPCLSANKIAVADKEETEKSA